MKPSFRHTGYTRQLEEEDFTQLDYSTGLPMQGSNESQIKKQRAQLRNAFISPARALSTRSQ